MKKILIIGPGAIGLSVGAALSAADHDVTFYSRQPFDQLTMTVGGDSRSWPAQVMTDVATLSSYDWVFLCVKAHQVASAADVLNTVAERGVCVAILQNGLEHAENVAPFAPEAVLLPVIVDIPAKRLSPGVVERQPRALLTVQDNATGHDFCALFNNTFVTATAVDDLITRAWLKLCINAPGGAILALTGQPMAVFHKPGIADLARAILCECVAVGRAEGAQLDDGLIERQMAAFMSAAPDESNSMHQDRLAGRETEWNARNAVLIRKGRKHGIPTPVSDILVPLLGAI